MRARRMVLSAAALVLIATLGTGAARAVSPASSEATASVRVEAADETATTTDAAARVAAMSLRERAAAVVMGHVPTTDPTVLRDYMTTSGVGGFILMGANVPASEAELRALTDALVVDSGLPPLIAVDQEGGDVSRLSWDGFAGADVLKSEAVEATSAAFAGRAALLQRAGIGVNFGVVADVTSDPGMFIHRRALGTTPESAAARVVAAVDAEGDAAMSTLKHFPGHGAAGGDSHVGIPATAMSKEEWSATVAAPFRAGIEAGAPLLMFGHLAYSAVDAAPASLSPEWHRIARQELGFDGVMLTDDLGMLEASGVPAYSDPVVNAVAAIAAGNDMVLTIVYSDAGTATRVIDGLVTAVESGSLPAERLDDAATRVLDLRLRIAAAGRGSTPCASCNPAG